MNALPDTCTLDSSPLERAQQAFADADWPAAAAALEEALRASPNSSELRILLGHARLNGKDAAGALEAYQACARLAPNQSVVHACCAMALQMLGRTTEAGAAAERALSLDATDAIALKVKARLAIDAGDVAAATQVCQTLMKLLPDDADVKRLADDCLAMPAVRAVAKPAAASRAGTVVGPASLFADYSSRVRAWANLGPEHLTHQLVVDDFSRPVESVVVPPAAAIASDGLPVPPASLTMGYGAGDLEHYIKCGQTSYERIARVLREREVTLGAGDAMLDWGGASGRVLRNFRSEAAAGCEVWGCDVHAPSIRWAQAHLSPTFRFFNSSSLPHLPFADGKFKFIYGLSVFTHLNAQRDLWLLELRRVLAKDGLLFLTVHNEDTWQWFRSKGMPGWMPASLRGHTTLPGECVEIRGDRWEHCYTLFSNDYLKRTWAPFFDGFEVIPCIEGYQSAVILRKRSA
ncbi:MAG TPA: tetratricopeptide repeat protein [Opitutaceae bacterium]